jgi:hypothetical protein
MNCNQNLRYFVLCVLFILFQIGFVISSEVETVECQSKDDDGSCRKGVETTADGVNIYWDLNGLDQDDPVLIQALKDQVLIPPDNQPLNLTYTASMKNLNGQFSQPKTVEKLLRKLWTKKKWKKKVGNGFFIEAGASEGEHISNTLYFELSHKVI